MAEPLLLPVVMRFHVCSALRRKAVWGSRRGVLPLTVLLFLSLVPGALAAGPKTPKKAKPGVPNSHVQNQERNRAQNHSLADELTRRVTKCRIDATVSVIGT